MSVSNCDRRTSVWAHRRLQRGALALGRFRGEAAARDQVLGQGQVERRQGDDETAPAGTSAGSRTEEDQRPEQRILGDTETQRRRAAACAAWAQPIAGDAFPRLLQARAIAQAANGKLDLGRRAESRGDLFTLRRIGQHEADVDRVADTFRGAYCRLDTARQRMIGNGNTISAQYATRLLCAGNVAPGIDGLADRGTCGGNVGRKVLRQRGRHLHQQVAIAPVVQHPEKNRDRLFR